MAGNFGERIKCIFGNHEWLYEREAKVRFTCNFDTAHFHCRRCGKKKIDCIHPNRGIGGKFSAYDRIKGE